MTNRPRNSNESRDAASYEPPQLTPLGNLHDLLAGTGTQTADGVFPAVSCAPNSDHTDTTTCGP